MIVKRGLLLVVFVLVLSGTVFAQSDVGLEDLEGVEESVDALRERVDQENLDFIGEQWKERALRNPVIKGLDTGFTNLNFIFVILFARSYSFSLAMLFVFLLWLFTFLSIHSYSQWFHMLFLLRDEWQRVLGSFAITIVLAQIQVFNAVSELMIKVIFFRSNPWWSLASAIVLFVGLFAYLKVNNYWAQKIRKTQEKREQEEVKSDTEANTAFRESMTEAVDG